VSFQKVLHQRIGQETSCPSPHVPRKTSGSGETSHLPTCALARTRTHTRARAHTHTRTHARTHARTHTHTHARARTHTHTHIHTHNTTHPPTHRWAHDKQGSSAFGGNPQPCGQGSCNARDWNITWVPNMTLTQCEWSMLGAYRDGGAILFAGTSSSYGEVPGWPVFDSAKRGLTVGLVVHPLPPKTDAFSPTASLSTATLLERQGAWSLSVDASGHLVWIVTTAAGAQVSCTGKTPLTPAAQVTYVVRVPSLAITLVTRSPHSLFMFHSSHVLVSLCSLYLSLFAHSHHLSLSSFTHTHSLSLQLLRSLFLLTLADFTCSLHSFFLCSLFTSILHGQVRCACVLQCHVGRRTPLCQRQARHSLPWVSCRLSLDTTPQQSTRVPRGSSRGCHSPRGAHYSRAWIFRSDGRDLRQECEHREQSWLHVRR
jgi:hypothetical protein